MSEAVQCPCPNCRSRAAEAAAITGGTMYRWYRPGAPREAGWTFTGIVSTWPDTGKVRAELWERPE